MINQVEEGARETVTARRGYKCPPSTAEPFAEGVEPIPRLWTDSPQLIKYDALILAARRRWLKGERGFSRICRYVF